MPRFALNQILVPSSEIAAFLALATRVGIDAVEIRNDLPAVPLGNEAAARTAGRRARDAGIEILSINALQRFNDWNAARKDEAQHLADLALASGAQAIVLCPVNDHAFRPDAGARRDGLRRALDGLMAILSPRGVLGLVEPLGFAECSLRSKREAVEIMAPFGASSPFSLVHDSFHHHLAGEALVPASRIGLVHISGVRTARAADTLRDPDRVLIDADDRIANVAQIASLIAAGYRGAVSFEPFSSDVANDPELEARLRDSIAFVRAALEHHQPAAITSAGP